MGKVSQGEYKPADEKTLGCAALVLAVCLISLYVYINITSNYDEGLGLPQDNEQKVSSPPPGTGTYSLWRTKEQ